MNKKLKHAARRRMLVIFTLPLVTYSQRSQQCERGKLARDVKKEAKKRPTWRRMKIMWRHQFKWASWTGVYVSVCAHAHSRVVFVHHAGYVCLLKSPSFCMCMYVYMCVYAYLYVFLYVNA